MIGDFNFPEVFWPDVATSDEFATSNKLHKKFLHFLISDLGHTQIIREPTHRSENVLDLLFTNVSNLIKNLKVLDQNEFCLADHFAISFEIEIDFKFRTCPKRKVYNYDKGDYKALNHDLLNINWDRVFSCNQENESI